MSNKKKKKFSLKDVTSDSMLFAGESIDKAPTVQDIVEIKLSDMVSHSKHVYNVVHDEKMDELIDSIKESGIITPFVLRKVGDKYEILSGHKRKYAAEKAGLTEGPARVLDIDDATADILMVDANIQREEILPSEKAKGYKVKLEALKQKGKDVIADPKDRTIDVLSLMSDDSATQIKRYLRLNFLSPSLLAYVDNKDMGFMTGVTLSYLKPDEQDILFRVINENNKKVSIKDAEKLRQASESGKFDGESCEKILLGEYAPRKPRPKFSESLFKSYIPERVSKLPEVKRISYFEKALKHYAEYVEAHPEEIDEL